MTIFSIANSVLLSEILYKEGDRLVAVKMLVEQGGSSFPASYLDVDSWRQQSRTLEPICASSNGQELNLTGGDRAERVGVGFFSACYFDLLGVRPAVGRSFAPEEENRSSPRAVAMLSHGLWRRNFGGDLSVVGGSIQLQGLAFQVIGILPESFCDIYPDIDLYVPVTMAKLTHREGFVEDRISRWLDVFARRRPGVSVQQAQEEMRSIARQLTTTFPAQPGLLGERRAVADLSVRFRPHAAVHSDPADRSDFRPASLDFHGKELAYITPPEGPMGQTGRPKSAAVHHRGWTNLLHWFVCEFEISPADKNLLMSSFSFDLTQRSMAMPLVSGGELHLVPDGYDSDLIRRILCGQKITLLNCAPSTFYPLLEGPEAERFTSVSSLRCLFLRGEAIAASRLMSWTMSEDCSTKIVNVYGAAESSDVTSFYRLHDFPCYARTSVPIGKPIYNSQIYLLDEDLRLVPTGVVGEIYPAGDGVGRGYLNDEGLTARKFVDDPFADKAGARLYRTGDLGRYLADGNLEFLGRIDHQVKIRGLRIELGEIETLLRAHPRVKRPNPAADWKTSCAGPRNLMAVGQPSARLRPHILVSPWIAFRTNTCPSAISFIC